MTETNGSGHRPQKWRDLPPVKVAVEVPDNRVSQTFLRTHDRCDRAAYLSLLHEGGTGSIEMNRGSVFHRFAHKAILLMLENEEAQIEPSTAKDLLLEVYDESPDLTVSARERDALRVMAYHFAEGVQINPEQVLGVEQSLELKIETPAGEWTVRGKVDLVESPHYGRIDVTDWKTSWAMIDTDDFEGDFQTQLYALLAKFGTVDGLGLPLARDAVEFGLYQRYPRYLREADGQPYIAYRHAVIHEGQLLDFRLDLEHQLRRLEASLESGLWPATPGKHCSECPSPLECPLPRHLRPDSIAELASLEELEQLAEWWYLEDRRVKQAKARVKAGATALGIEAVRIGEKLELAFQHRETSIHLDREKLAVAIEGAIEYGVPFDASKLTEKRSSIRFDVRDVPKE